MNHNLDRSPPLPWIRRAGRTVLRRLRPLAAPLLHRMQQRMQTAVEYSSLADGIRRSEADTGALRLEVLALLDAIRHERRAPRLEPDGRVGDILVHLPRLQLGLDALRRDQKESDNAARVGRSIIEEVLRLHQSQLTELHAGSAAGEASHKQTFGAVAELRVQVAALKDQLDTNAVRDDEVLGLARKVSDLQEENQTLLGLTLSRADTLLQRIVVPLGPDLLMRTPEGFLLVPLEDASLVATMWETSGRLEPGTVKVITSLLSEGDQVIDVGANIGLTVLPAARRVGASGRVVAVEPGSRASAVLARSIALHALSERVELHVCAAGEAVSKAHLNIGATVGHSSLLPLPDASRTEEVDVRPLDDLIESGRAVRLVKIDAEGFEPQVWRGMQRILADNPDLAIIVEFGREHLRRAGLSIEAWLSEFLVRGFKAYEIDEERGSLTPLRPAAELRKVSSVNILLTRQEPAALPLEFA